MSRKDFWRDFPAVENTLRESKRGSGNPVYRTGSIVWEEYRPRELRAPVRLQRTYQGRRQYADVIVFLAEGQISVKPSELRSFQLDEWFETCREAALWVARDVQDNDGETVMNALNRAMYEKYN